MILTSIKFLMILIYYNSLKSFEIKIVILELLGIY